MRSLGRFFQVTETTDVKKYFLDIDKIERFPITFVVKSNGSINDLRSKLEEGAKKLYSIEAIVNKYMQSIEEIINIPINCPQRTTGVNPLVNAGTETNHFR